MHRALGMAAPTHAILAAFAEVLWRRGKALGWEFEDSFQNFSSHYLGALDEQGSTEPKYSQPLDGTSKPSLRDAVRISETEISGRMASALSAAGRCGLLVCDTCAANKPRKLCER